MQFISDTFPHLQHLRPGNWTVLNLGNQNAIKTWDFSQYEHLAYLSKLMDENKLNESYKAIPMINGLEYYNEPKRGSLVEDALGYMVFNANNIEQSIKMVFILSSCASGGNGISITNDNFLECTSGFMARKIGSNKSNWVNSSNSIR